MDGERRTVWTALAVSREGERPHPGPLPVGDGVGAPPIPPLGEGQGEDRGEGRACRQIEVTVIRPGTSNNGLRYGEAVLAASVPLWSGAPSFCDHPGPLDQGRAGGRSVRDLVGVYAAPRYEPGRGVVATLRLYPHAEWLAEVVEAHLADEAAGRPTARLGISADMVVLKQAAGGRSHPLFDVVGIVAVNSADVVMNPSAGGRFERIVEAGELSGEGGALPTGSLPPGHQPPVRPAVDNSEQQEDPNMPGESTINGAPSPGSQTPVPGSPATPLILDLCGQVLEARLSALALPEPAREYLRAQFKGRAFAGAELDRAIEGVRGLLGEIAAPTVIAGAGLGRGARVALTSRERLQVALDRLFGIEPPDHLKDTPRLSGIREAYVALTGDRGFAGRVDAAESVLEANEVTTAVMADALADTLNKRLVADYRGQTRWWEAITSVVDLKDMRAVTRVLLNDFAALADVAENGAYANIAWGDTKETYTPKKVGNLVYVTMEMILNDDLQTVRRIPSKLAVAASITVNEYVAALFTANAGAGPAMACGHNVFDAANHGANTAANALSATNLETAMIAIAKQTNSAAKRLGLQGKWLLVPVDLQYAAAVICGTPLVTGSPNNDINPLAGQIQPIPVPQFTNAGRWYLLADRSQAESIEVGFLNGRTEPELLIQDGPTQGSVFTNDAITFKIRHVYGAGWLDYRGAYAGLP